MSVELGSPIQDYMLNGEYDPMVASENKCKYILECDNCGHTAKGTEEDLHDLEWEWSYKFNSETMHIKESEATCPKCNGQAEEQAVEIKKAAENPNQITITEAVQ